jgi:hypothetical protein
MRVVYSNVRVLFVMFSTSLNASGNHWIECCSGSTHRVEPSRAQLDLVRRLFPQRGWRVNAVAPRYVRGYHCVSHAL